MRRTEGNQDGDYRDVPSKPFCCASFCSLSSQGGQAVTQTEPVVEVTVEGRAASGFTHACVCARDEITDCRSQRNMRDIKLPVEFLFNASCNCRIQRRCR